MLQSAKILLSILVLPALFALFMPTSTASAVTAADWRAGNIIEDGLFYRNSDIPTASIQGFLNSKVPTCDTSGSQPYNGTTRAAYGASRGYPAPFVCLKNYSMSVQGKSADSYCSALGAGTKSAATIIYEISNACGISAKVLIVMLEKEQGLISDDWPWNLQYRSAMGYGCPDTAPCDAEYYGFFNQVYNAARQFKVYSANQSSYRHKPYQINYVYWSPNTGACGGTNVAITNRATAGLYNYTPYQPNSAALSNIYGSGDGCSAYGNRNFWRLYNDWFGSSSSLTGSVTMTTITQPNPNPARGETVTYSYSLTNNLTIPITFDAVGIVGRAETLTGANRDFGWQGSTTLQAGATQQFTFTSTVRDTGKVYAWPAILYQGAYVQYNNWGSTLNIHSPNFTLSQPLSTNPATIYPGQDVTFSAVLKNNEPYPISYDAIGIPVKFYDRYSYDATWVGPGILNPGEELTLSGLRNIDKPGPYTYWVSSYFSGTYSNIGSIKKFAPTEVTPNFSVSGVTFSNANPVKGESLGASFTVKNNLSAPIDVGAVGVVGRLGTFTGQNRDIGWQNTVHFNAGETKTFTGYSRILTEAGTHYYWIGILHNGSFIQYNNWGSTIISQAPNFSVSGLSLTNQNPIVGQNQGASFIVKNNLSAPIDVGAVGVVGRLGTFTGQNRDIGWQGPVHFGPGETKSFTGYSRTITDVGTHYYWIGVLNAGNYIQYNNWGSTVISRAP